jgi:hypothetical protein
MNLGRANVSEARQPCRAEKEDGRRDGKAMTVEIYDS